MEKIIFVMGDIHGEFRKLNEFIDEHIRRHPVISALAQDLRTQAKTLEVIILQCGDMAYFWPGYDNRGKIANEVSFLKGGLVKIYWCGGNHEDWDKLDILFANDPEAIITNMIEVDKGIIFCRFGATLELSSDLTVLFAGGAESVDMDYRLRKMAAGAPTMWWKQEGISEEDLWRLANVSKVDWVISHTAPAFFDLKPWLGFKKTPSRFNVSRLMLDDILWKYHPKKWFFGHFHLHMEGLTAGCQWECLPDISSREVFWQCIQI